MYIRRDEALLARNSLKLAGRATAFVAPATETEMAEAIHWARAEGLSLQPWGEGSNIVLCGDIDALVLQPANRGKVLLEQTADTVLIKVSAGENWHQLVKWALASGYYGLENLALIPGAVGAAAIQNIGAYGVELSRFLVAVNALDTHTGKLLRLSAAECQLAYRDSVFKHARRDQLLITSIELRLSLSPDIDVSYSALAEMLANVGSAELTPVVVFDAVVNLRTSKLPDPAVTPNVGSFFKNPVVNPERVKDLLQQFPALPVYPNGQGRSKLPAAYLIEHCGFKGKNRGLVAVHDKHALVLVNNGTDKGAEVLALATEIQHAVYQHFGITLDIEPRILGSAR